MASFSRRVLGIDPGSRQIGFAVFRGEELVFYGVKCVRTKQEAGTLSKLQEIVTNLTESYGIDIVAIERSTFPQQGTPTFKAVYKNIVRCIKNQKRALIELDPQLVRNSLCGNQKPTKGNTAQILVKTYRELEPYLDVQKIWSKRYYGQLFDAVAVGLACVRGTGSNTINDSEEIRTNRNDNNEINFKKLPFIARPFSGI